jgi:exonuclease SbcD
MRILHTSDWHLGHAFCDQSRHAEHAAFLDWLLVTIESQEVDALVVAGDVFDSPTSPNEAFQLYYSFLARLAALGGKTRSGGSRTAVIIGGNHDSPGRLDAPRDVLTALATQVVGGYDPSRTRHALEDPTGLVVPVAGAGGQVGLVIAAVPFLNDWRIGVRGFDAGPDEQRASMNERFREVYAALADKASRAYPDVPLLATGHLTCLATAGAQVTADDAVPLEINRVGTLGAMGPGIFDPRFSYVALGHIHRGFHVDDARRVHYSGTPIQIGSAEGPDTRRVLLVDVDAKGVQVQPLAVPCRRRLLSVSGRLDEVRAKLELLQVPEGEDPPFVSVRVALDAPEPRVIEFVREAAQRNRLCAPKVVEVQAGVQRSGPAVQTVEFSEGTQVTPEAAFLFAWQSSHGRDSQPAQEVWQRFRSLIEAGQGGGK